VTLERVRVAVRPYVESGTSGGVVQYVQGLVLALGRVDGPAAVDVLGRAEDEAWLAPYVNSRVRFARCDSQPLSSTSFGRRARESLAYRAGHLAKRWLRTTLAQVPGSDGVAEARRYDLVHYPTQYALDTELPFVYQPWDLQHRHFPEFFTPTDLRFRELMYGHFCRKASVVIVASSFVRHDVMEAFDLPDERVALVPAASPLELSDQLSEEDEARFVTTKGVPQRFALYPAYGWPHKNHLRLIEALGILKARGVVVPLVCSGNLTEQTQSAARRAVELGLDHVQFLGRLSGSELRCLYSRADCVVFPSLFEGFGLPVLEGFNAGLPVACSDTTSLPELAGDAAALFDPLDLDSIADAIERVWTDDLFRDLLITRGRQRASRYSWDRVASDTITVYRAALGMGPHG